MDKNNENYLKIRQAFYQQDMSKEKRYVDKMCDLYFNEKIPFNEIVHLFRVYEENREIPDATGVDFNKSNYEKLSSFIYKITGEYLSRWKMPNVVYNENGITISLIKNYEEAKNVPCFNTWCVFNNKDYWMTHKQDGDTIYLMRLVKDFHSTFYSVRVEKNGQRHYYAYDHTELSNVSGKYPSFDDIEQTIGTNGIKTLIPRIINESKTHKNMNKKVIKINESQLRNMVAESVKKIFKEGENVPFLKVMPDGSYASWTDEEREEEQFKNFLFHYHPDALDNYEYLSQEEKQSLLDEYHNEYLNSTRHKSDMATNYGRINPFMFESQLHKIISESVKKVLKEGSGFSTDGTRAF